MKNTQTLGPSAAAITGNWLVLAFLILPMTIVLPLSLTDRPYLSMPQGGLSLAHYAKLFASSDWLASFAQSGIIGAAATAIALVAGVSCTVGCWLLGTRFSNFVRALMLMPLIIPSVVYALGIYRFFIQLGLLDTYTGVIIAHAVTGMPYVVITTVSALAGFDSALVKAARGLGANYFQVLRMVVLPNILPGIVSGGILAFMHSWDEIVIVLFIASREIFTVPRRIWDGLNDQLDPMIAAVAAVMIVISIALLVLNRTVMALRDSKGQAGIALDS